MLVWAKVWWRYLIMGLAGLWWADSTTRQGVESALLGLIIFILKRIFWHLGHSSPVQGQSERFPMWEIVLLTRYFMEDIAVWWRSNNVPLCVPLQVQQVLGGDRAWSRRWMIKEGKWIRKTQWDSEFLVCWQYGLNDAVWKEGCSFFGSFLENLLRSLWHLCLVLTVNHSAVSKVWDSPE